MTKGFFKAAQGVIVVYSINDQKSFHQVNKWMDFITENAPKEVKVLLVGNKSDLKNERQVSTEAGEECAKKYNISFMESSAYDGNNVEEAFANLGERIMDDFNPDIKPQIPFHLQKKKKDKCCK